MEQLQHAMLDQRIDRAEKELEEESGKELLNLKSAIPHGEGVGWPSGLDTGCGIERLKV